MPGTSDRLKSLSENDFLELSLLLPSWQVDALGELAERNGMNVGQLLRRLIGNMLREMAHSPD